MGGEGLEDVKISLLSWRSSEVTRPWCLSLLNKDAKTSPYGSLGGQVTRGMGRGDKAGQDFKVQGRDYKQYANP